MELLLQCFLLFVGLVLLWKSGEWSVQSAIGFSRVYGIETFTVGFFIFAISTGLPEISSAVVSSIKGVPEVSAGTLVGSSLANITLILGIVLLVAKEIKVDGKLRPKLLQTIGLMTAIIVGLAFFPSENLLTGILLIILYVGAFFWFQVGIPKKSASKELKEVEEVVETIEKHSFLPPKVDILLRLMGSLAFLVLSSWLTVHSGTELATLLGIELSTIGATLIAVGTSFPELALEIHAVRRKEYDLALGDVFGSSLLNVSLIMGILVAINPSLNLAFSRKLLPFILGVVGWIVWKIWRKRSLGVLDGAICLGIFGLYVLRMFFIA